MLSNNATGTFLGVNILYAIYDADFHDETTISSERIIQNIRMKL